MLPAMRRVLGALLLSVLPVAGCSGATDWESAETSRVPTGPISISECVDPPASEIGKGSYGDLLLVPDPVAAGSEATVLLTQDNVPIGGTTDPELRWQCWNGSAWATTHYVIRGFINESAYVPPMIQVGSTTTLANISFYFGLSIPNESRVLVPDVPAGTYRLVDEIQIPDYAPIPVVGYVEVQHEDS